MKRRTIRNRAVPNSLRLLLSLTMIAALAALCASPAFAGGTRRAARAAAAGTCAQDLFTAAGNSQNLGCTANDISLTGAKNARDPLTGGPLSNCVSGQPFNVLIDFTVQSTSNKTRSNVGLYLGTIPVGEPGSSALTGSCDDNILALPHNKTSPFAEGCTAGTAGCLGDANYDEEDGSASDNCGDAAAASTHTVTVELDNVICPNVGSTAVVLPDCTTWQVPGKTIACFSDPTQGWPFVAKAAIPGTTSKCNCGQVSIPVTPINPKISVTKTPNPSSVVEPGGTVTYTVVVKNTTGAAVPIAINQICDDQFGNIATASTTPPQPGCPTGTLGSASNINCSLPTTIGDGQIVTCTFDGAVSGTEPEQVKDTVTAHGVGSGIAVTAQASATVTIGESVANAQASKTLDSGHECAVARYTVEVDNISVAGTDESETLTALNDSPFGDLTKLGTGVTPKVVGTNCGVATSSPGLGTASDLSGAGALGSIAVGGSYTCKFDGEFCGALGSGCLSNKDTLTASLTLDGDGVCSGGTNDGNLCKSNTDCPGTGAACILTLSPTASLTVNSCFTTSP